MERLTNHFNYCECFECNTYNKLGKDFCMDTFKEFCFDKKVYDKLREYEDLEDQQLLLKLPCNVGDTLYFVKGKNHAEIEELEVMKFVYSNELDIMFSDEFYEVGLVSIKEIGKTVFLTEEAAKKALERMNKK